MTAATLAPTRAARTLTVTPLSPTIGASVSGVDLNDLDDATFAQIHAAFLQHCMLVFRDQRITPASQIAFARRWGEVVETPMLPYLDGYPGLRELTNIGKERTPTENWHYDSSFMEKPPAVTVLAAKKVPPVGGDTMWCNQYLAYEALSPGMQRLLDGVRARYCGVRLARTHNHTGEIPQAFHPVVRTHPETGRKALYVGHPDTVPQFEHMTVEESRTLLDHLYRQSPQPDRTVRHVWRDGDVLIWDNRCTMHYAIHDYGTQERVMHRVTIAGTRPE